MKTIFKTTGLSRSRYLTMLLLAIVFCSFFNNSAVGQPASKNEPNTSFGQPEVKESREQSPHPENKLSESNADPQVNHVISESGANTPHTGEGFPDNASHPDTGDQQVEADRWESRFNQLEKDIQAGKKTSGDADVFYQEVGSALKSKRSELSAMMRSWKQLTAASTAIEAKATSREMEAAEALYKEIIALYRIRINLLQKITPELRSKVTGMDLDGVRELKGEVRQVILGLSFQTLASPNLGQRMISNFKKAPVPAVVIVLKLVLVIVVFRLWRRWARKNIVSFHRNLLRAQSKKKLVRYSAIFLWYFERLRSPLEWLLLVWLFFQIADPKYIQIIDDILFTQIRWFLLAWFCIAFVSAMSKRGAGGLKSETASLRLKSLRLAIGWLLLTLLALNFAEDLSGKGTIYEWVWLLFSILAVPVFFLILSWWRGEIFRLLEMEPSLPAWVEPVLKDKTGLRSYKGALIGATHLLLNWIRQRILRVVTSFDGGRALVASLTQMEAARVSELQNSSEDEKPIPKILRDKLLENDAYIIEDIAREEISILAEHVTQGRNAVAAVISGRGGGKSLLLQRLAMETGQETVIFECPPGGYDEFYRSFIEAIALNGENVLPETISRQLEESGIKIVGIDNLHQLSRPVLGGQRDLDRAAKLINSIRADVLWVLTLDRSAWQYISQVSAHKMLLEDILELPLWNESQIKVLIEHRIAKVGIEIDYSRLPLPGQYDDIQFETLEERNRSGYYRILWNASDGNPVFALRLWIESLSMTKTEKITVRIPQPLPTKKLERLSMTSLLVLRAIAQMGMATQQDIVESLKLPEVEVAPVLRFAVSNGWVEKWYAYYYITWEWYLGIRRVLARQNLMPRRTLGGSP